MAAADQGRDVDPPCPGRASGDPHLADQGKQPHEGFARRDVGHLLHAAPGVGDVPDQGGPGVFVELPGSPGNLDKEAKGAV